jgi:hypothetical protein
LPTTLIEKEQFMAEQEQGITLADIKALGDKLDSADLTPAEKALLAAAMDTTAKVIGEGGEVEGFGYYRSSSLLRAPVMSYGMGSLFENSFSRVIGKVNPGIAATNINISGVSTS